MILDNSRVDADRPPISVEPSLEIGSRDATDLARALEENSCDMIGNERHYRSNNKHESTVAASWKLRIGTLKVTALVSRISS